MATEKRTVMDLKVDLQCPCCYKKIRKTLCKFPQIRDQMYDEKKNRVTITVMCCSPEKIRDKLCSKGGKVIKSIEIIEEGKPKQPEKKEADKPKETDKPKAEKPKEKPKEAEKAKEEPKGADKPKEKQKEAEKPKEEPKGADKPKEKQKEAEKPKANGPPPVEKPKEAPKAEPAANQPPAAAQAKALESVPVYGVPSVFPYVGPSYDAYAAGPYYHGYGFPPPPPQPCFEGYHGHGHGYGHGHAHANRCDSYFSEENPQACSVM